LASIICGDNIYSIGGYNGKNERIYFWNKLNEIFQTITTNNKQQEQVLKKFIGLVVVDLLLMMLDLPTLLAEKDYPQKMELMSIKVL